ncbi:MAG: TetR/AcrR family transcriptional regulator [Alcanivoracaceae bacterium]
MENRELDAIREVVSRVLDAEKASETRYHARSEILVHAIGVFARRGLERTTVQHLLDAAGISRRTFYKYFRNKLDVLESIYEISVTNMILRFRREVERSQTVNDVIHNMCHIYFDYHLSLGPIIRLMMEEARRADSVLAPHRARAYETVANVMQNELYRLTGQKLDLLVHKTLIWTLENYSLYLLNESDCTQEKIDHCKTVMAGISEAILVHGVASPLLQEPRLA